MENQPLVSIVVITYNSSKYVLETLESAKAQTYQNIELIVTDDCSTDNTVEICREWIDSNKDRFVRTELITVQQNTGVSPNCNRGYRAAQGEWIKGIAGDDILLSNCIDDYVCFAKENTSAWICHSDAIIFNNTNSSHLFCQHLKVFTSKESTALQQYNFLAVNCSIIAPTVFIKADLYKVLGGFDESIRLCEDWPMWLKVTLNGYKFYYINRPTVRYRVHDQSISVQFAKGVLYSKFYLIDHLIYNKYIKGKAPLIIKLMHLYNYSIKKSLDCIGMNKPNICYRKFHAGLMLPYHITSKFFLGKFSN